MRMEEYKSRWNGLALSRPQHILNKVMPKIYLELLLALVVSELLGLPVFGLCRLLALLWLSCRVSSDGSMHLCVQC